MSFTESDREGQVRVAAFREAFEKLGWAEGHNLRIDARWTTPGDVESRQRFVKELIALRPDLIFSHGTPATAALLQQTRTIPIVFAARFRPTRQRLRCELPAAGRKRYRLQQYGADDGQQVAGAAQGDCSARQPGRAPVQPGNSAICRCWLSPFKTAAASFTLEPIAAPVRDASELETVVAAQAREPNGGLIVMPDTFTSSHRAEIAALAARYRLPAIYPFRFFAEVGGLLSYGNDLTDDFRRAATYADRILKGAKPSELPVQLPVKFELVINLKTAKTLGLEVPLLLQHAPTR